MTNSDRLQEIREPTVGDWIHAVRLCLMDISLAGTSGPQNPDIREGFTQIEKLAQAAIAQIDDKESK